MARLALPKQRVPAELRQAAHFSAMRAVQEHLVTAVEDFINEGAVPAERMIRDLISCEHSYINTDHPQFIGGSRAIAHVMEQRQQVRQRLPECLLRTRPRVPYA